MIRNAGMHIEDHYQNVSGIVKIFILILEWNERYAVEKISQTLYKFTFNERREIWILRASK